MEKSYYDLKILCLKLDCDRNPEETLESVILFEKRVTAFHYGKKITAGLGSLQCRQ
jgi:hypothetical protein